MVTQLDYFYGGLLKKVNQLRIMKSHSCRARAGIFAIRGQKVEAEANYRVIRVPTLLGTEELN